MSVSSKPLSDSEGPGNDLVCTLVELGFEQDAVVAALLQCNNSLDEAAELLVQQSFILDASPRKISSASSSSSNSSASLISDSDSSNLSRKAQNDSDADLAGAISDANLMNLKDSCKNNLKSKGAAATDLDIEIMALDISLAQSQENEDLELARKLQREYLREYNENDGYPSGCLGAFMKGVVYVHNIGKRRYLADEHAKQHPPLFLLTISAVQVVVFVVMMIVGRGFAPPSENPLLGPDVSVMVQFGGNEPLKMRSDFESNWSHLIIPVFLHAGFLHIVANLYAQIYIGYQTERCWGLFPLMTTYFLSSIGGNIATSVFTQTNVVSVGASGGVMGLIGAVLGDIIKNYDDIWNPRSQVIYWSFNSVMFLSLGAIPMVDNFVHVAGFFVGFLTSLVVAPCLRPKPSLTRAIYIVVPTIILLGLFAAGFAVLATKTSVQCGLACCVLFMTTSCVAH